MQRFAGKTCVVTASTQGIGYAIAERFAQEGANVVVSSRKQQAVDETVANLRSIASNNDKVIGLVCHVNKAQDRKAVFEAAAKKFGSIDVLVLNAASSLHFGSTVSTSEKAFDAMFQTNVKSTFLFAQEATPFLTKSSFQPGAFSTNILLVASIAGYNPAAPIGIYGVTKSAMLGLTKALATDFAAQGVRVNCLAPGVIRTNFASLLVDAIENKEKSQEQLAAGLDGGLMKRVGEPREMGAVAAFLCSADASFVTGEVMIASGGTHSRL